MARKDIPAADPVAKLVKRMWTLFRDRLDEDLRPYGITTAQLQILFMLRSEPGVSGAKLARLCRVTPQTTQTLLKTMERNGWVERHKHAENERILLVSLTRSGRSLLERSHATALRLQKQMLAGFRRDEIRLLESMLERCIHNLEQPSSQVLDRASK
jgi:DNA-binding MarR family transcriptional regulator